MMDTNTAFMPCWFSYCLWLIIILEDMIILLWTVKLLLITIEDHEPLIVAKQQLAASWNPGTKITTRYRNDFPATMGNLY